VEKLTYKQQKFTNALDALKRSIKVFSRTDIDEDIRENLVASIIKHFEMCYEALWKFLKLYLEIRYAEIVDSPKKVFRQCFALGIIDESTTKELLNISEARNATTHDYDEENAQEICQRIGDYYITFEKLKNIALL
jgi:nucleotidyltransferase substrate binding protein (TIGR01987 family)